MTYGIQRKPKSILSFHGVFTKL